MYVCVETVQRRATKFILNNLELDYKSRLVYLNLLQLMFWFKLADVLFTRLKISYVPFSATNTRSASSITLLHHPRSRTNLSRHFYFKRVCRLWNVLPPIDLNLFCGHSLLKTLPINILFFSLGMSMCHPSLPTFFHHHCTVKP